MIKNVFNPENRLFSLARNARWLPPVLLALVLAIVFTFGGQLIGSIPLAFLMLFGLLPTGEEPLSAALWMSVFFLLTLAPTGLLLWLWVRLVEKRGLSSLGLEKNGALFKLARGLLIGCGLFLFITLLLAVCGCLQPVSSLPGRYIISILSVFLVLPAWLFQSSIEELVMRGWLMPVIAVRKSPFWGVLISSSVFAVLHLLNPNISILAVVNLVVAGLLFALVALWEGGLWGACGLHAAWNWTQGSLLGFSVSGFQFSGPALFHLGAQGSSLLSGGAFGPEGSLFTTLVNGAACVVLILLIRRKNIREKSQ